MHESAKTAGGITEASGGLFGGKPFDEVGAEGFVLALAGVFGFKEMRGEC
jgi:hypothetical protein